MTTFYLVRLTRATSDGKLFRGYSGRGTTMKYNIDRHFIETHGYKSKSAALKNFWYTKEDDVLTIKEIVEYQLDA